MNVIHASVTSNHAPRTIFSTLTVSCDFLIHAIKQPAPYGEAKFARRRTGGPVELFRCTNVPLMNIIRENRWILWQPKLFNDITDLDIIITAVCLRCRLWYGATERINKRAICWCLVCMHEDNGSPIKYWSNCSSTNPRRFIRCGIDYSLTFILLCIESWSEISMNRRFFSSLSEQRWVESHDSAIYNLQQYLSRWGIWSPRDNPTQH